jgi:hypothetical protein
MRLAKYNVFGDTFQIYAPTILFKMLIIYRDNYYVTRMVVKNYKKILFLAYQIYQIQKIAYFTLNINICYSKGILIIFNIYLTKRNY